MYGMAGLVRRRRGSIDHIKSTVSMAKKSATIMGRPINITIEPTNICNLKCPVCETGAGVLGRERRTMTMDQFKKIIQKIGRHTNTIMFYFMGEPFLNKHAYKMIRYAKDSGIPFVDSCTNGEFIQPGRLIDSGLDRVSFQICGMTQDTHQIYRVNGDLARTINNLKETLRLKRERSSSIRIETGFIVMKHNEHEIDKYKRYMSELGVDRASVIAPCVRTIDQGKELLPANREFWVYDEVAFLQGSLRPRVLSNNFCPWIYFSMAILVNGDVVPCCRDPHGKEIMGNIFDQSFYEIWNGKRYRNFRTSIHNNQKSVGICRLCSSYPPSAIH